MTTKNRTLYSDLAIPPGETLAEELEARGMSQKELAKQMNRPPQVVSEIIRAKKAITPETALDLERTLGVSAQFWLGLETRYQLTLARNRQRQSKPKMNLNVADESAEYNDDSPH